MGFASDAIGLAFFSVWPYILMSRVYDVIRHFCLFSNPPNPSPFLVFSYVSQECLFFVGHRVAQNLVYSDSICPLVNLLLSYSAYLFAKSVLLENKPATNTFHCFCCMSEVKTAREMFCNSKGINL